LIASGAAHGLDEQAIIREHGLTFVHNDPRAEITSLYRVLAGRP
jgi:hypothetical protein